MINIRSIYIYIYIYTYIYTFYRHFYIYTLGYDNSNFSRWEMGFTYEMMLETLPQIFHTASIWLTLALAMQRYIYVCHALAARSWCTMDRTRRAVALIFLFAFLHQATRYEFTICFILNHSTSYCFSNHSS
jgi:hypothetical protein